MSLRLLSFLSVIETAIGEGAGNASAGAGQRMVDYTRGIARMVFADGSGTVMLQHFTLADGQVCVRVGLQRADAGSPIELTVYPKGGDFDWREASQRVAQTWLSTETSMGAAANSGRASVEMARIETLPIGAQVRSVNVELDQRANSVDGVDENAALEAVG